MIVSAIVFSLTRALFLSTATPSDETGSFVNSLGMQMVLIHPDQFLTGTRLDRSNWQWYERAEVPRWVNIHRPFHMAAHEVTNAQYRKFTQETKRADPQGLLLRGLTLVRDFEPWKDPAFNADQQPVVCVTYADAQAFCQWLAAREKRSYRLPTSDEWEYACRAGWGTDYNWGSNTISPEMANYDPLVTESDLGAGQPHRMFGGHPKPVGSFKPNAWGLFDMHGNVNEMTSTGETFRVVRGGGWNDSARRCRSASVRDRWKSDCGMAGIGFRVVCEVPLTRRLQLSLGDPIVVKAVIEKECIEAARKIVQLRDGTLVVQNRISKDGGKTWSACPLQPNPTALQMSDGTIISIPFIVPRDKDKPAGWGKVASLRSTDGWRTVAPYEATFHVPDAIGGFDDGGNYRDAIGYCDHDVVEIPSGDLLMTMYGFWQSARVLSDYQRYPIETQQWKYVAWIVKSSDKGRSWTYLSKGIFHPELTRGGGCELGLIRLANGHLLLAGRTGEHGNPNERMLFVWSKDSGATWIEPSQPYVDGRPLLGIFPQFVLMSNGILAMTWGRTGDMATAVAFSLDGSGKTWTDVAPIPDDMGGYNDMVEAQPGTLLISSSKKVGDGYDLRLIPVTVRRQPG
jgi:formylglycine-generating enzyme required for sulfatase activity